MKHPLRLIAAPVLIALGLSLAGCDMGTSNRGMEAAHQPVVSRIDYAMDLRLAGTGTLADGEAQRLRAWFDSLKIGYGDRVALDDRTPYGNGAIRDDVATAAARYGLLLSEGAPVTAGAFDDGAVRVIVSRMTAAVPGCPDWSRRSQPEFGGSTMSNFGCGVNSNFAAMVANPEDLILGQSDSGGNDARLSCKAIKSFREKAPSGTGDLKNSSSKEQ